jgi:Permeases of the drug/metabolite transporter (DMT) superfamily
MKKQKWLTNSIIVCFLASICCALWGSAFPFVKIGYRLLQIPAGATSEQILFAGVRFTLAGILTIVIGSLVTRRILIPAKESWGKILILSVFQTILQYVFFYIGLSNTTGVKASIIEGMNVFVSLLVASTMFRMEKLTGKKLIGCIIGFLGVILVNVNKDGLDTNFKLIGEGFIIVSIIAYAFSSVLLKHYSKKENAIILSGYQFIIGGFVMMLIGSVSGGKIEHYNTQSIAIIIYLACVSAIAYSIWAILLKYNTVSKVSVYGFMTPVFGVILSAALLGEQELLGYKCLFALILVSLGILIVNKDN